MKYLYKCKNNHEIEISMPMASDKPQTLACEACGEVAQRIFNPTPFKFRVYNRTPDHSGNHIGEAAFK